MAGADRWSPEQYGKFRDQRKQPFVDLVSMVRQRPDMRVADLGCGPGELTVELHEILGARQTVGVDSSESMLSRAPEHPGVSFVQQRIEELEAEPFDLVFSNAALHWVEDHPAVFARLAELVAPGGQIAVQVPANHVHPAYRAADEVAALPQFAGPLGGYQRGVPVLQPEQYAQLLYELGFAQQSVRLQVYGHELEGPEHVIEWVKGALLLAYEQRMPPASFGEFSAEYRTRLLSELPDSRPYFFTFNRILMWGNKPSLS